MKRKYEKDILSKVDNLGNTLTNHLLDTTHRKTWSNYTTKNPKLNPIWTGIYPYFIEDRTDTPFFPHIVLYLLEEEVDALIAINIEFKEPLSMLESKNSNELIEKIKGALGAEIFIRKKLSNSHIWTREPWEENIFPIYSEDLTLVLLGELIEKMKKPRHSSYNKEEFSPVFLIQYKINKNELLSNECPMEFLKEKVSLLAPIVECLCNQ